MCGPVRISRGPGRLLQAAHQLGSREAGTRDHRSDDRGVVPFDYHQDRKPEDNHDSDYAGDDPTCRVVSTGFHRPNAAIADRRLAATVIVSLTLICLVSAAQGSRQGQSVSLTPKEPSESSVPAKCSAITIYCPIDSTGRRTICSGEVFDLPPRPNLWRGSRVAAIADVAVCRVPSS